MGFKYIGFKKVCGIYLDLWKCEDNTSREELCQWCDGNIFNNRDICNVECRLDERIVYDDDDD